MISFFRTAPCAAAVVAVAMGLAFAPSSSAQTLAAPMGMPATPSSTSDPLSPKALDDGALSSARGGQVVVVGNQTLKSTIAGSTINGNYAAGTINFAGNALSNFSGLGNVVVNTGAQANLQSAMNLTVNLGN